MKLLSFNRIFEDIFMYLEKCGYKLDRRQHQPKTVIMKIIEIGCGLDGHLVVIAELGDSLIEVSPPRNSYQQLRSNLCHRLCWCKGCVFFTTPRGHIWCADDHTWEIPLWGQTHRGRTRSYVDQLCPHRKTLRAHWVRKVCRWKHRWHFWTCPIIACHAMINPAFRGKQTRLSSMGGICFI